MNKETLREAFKGSNGIDTISTYTDSAKYFMWLENIVCDLWDDAMLTRIRNVKWKE